MSLTDQDLLSAVQYAVIEPADGGATWPSGLWTAAEVLGYANQRQQDFLKLTGLVLTHDDTIITIPNTHRHALPADYILPRRVAWAGSDGVTHALARSDGWEADSLVPTWSHETVDRPLVYMTEEVPQRELQVAPASYDGGILDLLYVALPTLLTAAGVALTLPDEFAPYLKYGILADCFNKIGRGHDAARAAYCELRYQEGILVARSLLEGWA